MTDAKQNTAETQKISAEVLPWKTWLAVVFVVVIFVVSQLAASIIVSFYPLAQHMTTAQANDWLNDSVFGQFVFILLAEAIVLGALYAFLKRYNVSWQAIGLRRPRWKDLGWGLLALPAYMLFYLLFVSVASLIFKGLDVNQEQQIGFQNVSGLVPLAITFASLVILPAFTEEVLMRGFLYGSLKKALPLIWAALITSVLFAVAHLPEGGDAGPLYIAGIDTFVLSLVLIYLREKTDGLWAPITLHALKNGIAFTALFVLHLS